MKVRAMAVALSLSLAAGTAGVAAPPDFQKAAERMIATVEAAQQVPGASPALALVAVPAEGEPVLWVEGKVWADGAHEASAETPFYIASMTKSFVGLLAVELDRKGVFPLETTLGEIWPGLSIEGVSNPESVTMEDLLTHRFPFRNDPLSFRTAYVGDVPANDYRGLIENASTPHDGSFSYTNLGYLIYGAAIESRTGQSWKDALAEHVLGPIGLENTSAYPSRFDPGRAAGGHQWAIDRFVPARLKPDTLMHAAGGLVSSPADMARWLKAWLDKSGGGIPAASFAQAQRLISEADQEMGPDMKCVGYAMGWNVCEIGRAKVYLHGGGYTGVRAVMAWSDDVGAALAILSNSDSMTGQLTQELTRQFFLSLSDPATELPPVDAFAARYAERVRGLADNRLKAAAERRAEALWEGWRWSPEAAQLAAYVGRYDHVAYGPLWISLGESGLIFRIGERRTELEPAANDLFATSEGPLDAPGPVHIERDRSGRIAALLWEEERFTRAD